MELLNRFYILLLCYSLIISSVLGEDLSSEDDHKQSDIPRVRIKVFRGPNKEENGQAYASWGFWIKQPSQK